MHRTFTSFETGSCRLGYSMPPSNLSSMVIDLPPGKTGNGTMKGKERRKWREKEANGKEIYRMRSGMQWYEMKANQTEINVNRDIE